MRNLINTFFNWPKVSGKNNKIIVGGKSDLRKIPGLELTILGNDNIIRIECPNVFQNCRIFINANNSSVEIKNCLYMHDTQIRIIRADGQKFSFGNGASVKGADIRLCDNGGEIIIEDEVLMSDGISIWASDGHSIVDDSGEIINCNDSPVIIGRHSWIGQKVGILKGAIIPPNTVVGFGAVVNKPFTKQNTILAGSPARIIKENVKWEELPPNINARKKRMVTVMENRFCCGCSACEASCPAQALKIDVDVDGFYKPGLDSGKCTNCRKCVKICPFNNPNTINDNAQICYAFAADKAIEVKHATAGGFGWIAKDFIKRGGKVVGAAWGNDFRVEHIIVDNLDALARLYRSKYAQSFMGDIYKETKAELDRGTQILFSGMPCQIAGLYATLGHDYDNLYTIDLLCHHAPSGKQLQRYLQEKYGANLRFFEFCATALDNQYNYNTYTYTYTYTDGSRGDEDFRQDLWGQAFLAEINKGVHCENCRFKGLPRFGDLTLGDFHGLRLVDAEFMRTKPAVAMANNFKGTELLEIVRANARLFKEKTFDLMYSIQSSFNPTHKNPNRDRFFDLTQSNTITESLRQVIEPNHSKTYPRWVVRLICLFIFSRKRRRKFRKEHTK